MKITSILHENWQESHYFLLLSRKKALFIPPARSLISHLHALTRNEPARAVVTDKFNTFTLEQELNMDETLREFFNDVYEITRQIRKGKSTHLRQDRRAGGTTATRPVGRPGNGTIPGRQDAFLPSCREQRRANCPGMAPTTHPARKRGRHLPGQRVRGHEKHLWKS